MSEPDPSQVTHLLDAADGVDPGSTALLAGTSPRPVGRQWAAARAWLDQKMASGGR